MPAALGTCTSQPKNRIALIYGLFPPKSVLGDSRGLNLTRLRAVRFFFGIIFVDGVVPRKEFRLLLNEKGGETNRPSPQSPKGILGSPPPLSLLLHPGSQA